jgi:hypothetical protein
LTSLGFPIRRSPDQGLLNDSPELIAAGRVLHRLPAPRHPPYALSNLTIKFSQDKKAANSIVKELIYRSITPPGGYGLLILSLQAKQSHRQPLGLPRHYIPRNDAKNLVELTGIEPATSGVQNRRSPN